MESKEVVTALKLISGFVNDMPTLSKAMFVVEKILPLAYVLPRLLL